MADLGLGVVPTIPSVDQPRIDEETTPVVITVDGEKPKQKYDERTRTLTLENEDGSAVILLDQDPPSDNKDQDDSAWNANLAEKLDAFECGRIVSDLMQAVDADDQSRQEWLKTRAMGIEMLGFRLEDPRSDTTFSSAPLEGMSVIRHPLLAEAVIRFQANASAELYPPEGPVKVYDDTPPTPTGMANAGETDQVSGQPVNTSDDLAAALEKDFNHYLTVTDSAYRADSVRMLFGVGFGGCGFKKVYFDPIRRRPCSRSVDAKDLIVNNDAISLEDAGRVTHRVTMRQSVMRRMQLAGAYRDIRLGQPHFEPNDVDRAVAEAQGFTADYQRAEDEPYVIDEIYCELDLSGFEHKEDGKPTGLPLPYRVSIERSTRTLLEVRRNWREDDDTYTPKRVFVKFGFVPALGFYDIGLLNILGNADRALTAAWREMLDAGMFSVFPGVLVSDAVGRQFTNQIRIPPGGAMVLKTNGQPISSVISPLPYKEPSIAMMQLISHIEQIAQRIGGVGEMPAGEGRADAPVGTTLALIEQATKVLAAVHVGLHASQAEEFQVLKDLFLEDPESFWRQNRRPSRKWEQDQFIEAINNSHVVPHADPNMPTHLHRIMKAVAVKQLQAMNPALYDAKAVDARILRMIGFSDPEQLFAPPGAVPPGDPGAPPPDPAKMAALQLKAQSQQQEQAYRLAQLQQQDQMKQRDNQVKVALGAQESQDRAADRQNRVEMSDARLKAEQMKLQDAAVRQSQQQAHEAGQGDMDRQHDAQQEAIDRAHQQQQDQIQREHQGGMAQAQQQHTADQAETQRDHTADQAEVERRHAEALAEMQRKHEIEMEEERRKQPKWPRPI